MRIVRSTAFLTTFCFLLTTIVVAQNVAEKDVKDTSVSKDALPEWLTKTTIRRFAKGSLIPPCSISSHFLVLG